MRSIIQITDLRKQYNPPDGAWAVKDVDLEIEAGEVFSLLGPNGAGKTSTLESLEGLRKPDGGSLNILGVDPVRQPQKLRNLIGVQLQSSGLPPILV